MCLANAAGAQRKMGYGGLKMSRVRFVHTVFLSALILAGAGYPAIAAPADETSAREAAITIDAGRMSEPVSKYIYGQFIEHLGRCIYGGIWAEMLEDRKFYYAVGADKSPWKALSSEAVKMLKENSYVGEHTPHVQLTEDGRSHGIQQGRLGLIKGKQYTGRIVLAARGTAKVKVSLVWGPGQQGRQSLAIDVRSAEYGTTPLKFTSGGTTGQGRLEIVGRGEGTFSIGTVSLMPSDNIKGMRADTLKLLKELDSPIYRWPGGNFVSGYEWRDGIGERDKRPPRPALAWNALESNDFGIDEFIFFCRLLDTEPYIAVNSGFGDDHSAAQEVEYVNGPPDTPMGRRRAANGHREPYNVKWWGIGNEMYGKRQLGYMNLKHYTQKHNLFAKAMRKVDPSIKLIAVGSVGAWSEGMLKSCAEYMDHISEHFYCERDKESLTEYVSLARNNIRGKVTAHRDYRKRLKSLEGRDIRIAIDEWNYWRGPRHYFLKDALGIAAGFHEMIRNSDIVFMANYAQTVNVIGAIKTTKTAAAFDTTGLVLKLYRNHFGAVPVTVTGNTAPLDVVAAWTSDRLALTIAIVNPTERKYRLMTDLKGAKPTGTGTLRIITHSDPMAYNEPGKDPRVRIIEKTISGVSRELETPALSISLYLLAVK